MPKPTVTPTARQARTPSAICPWAPRHSALQRCKVTHHGTRKTARIAENSQLAGRFRRWWQVLGSNQRRLSRRFYSPILLFKSYAADLGLCLSRRDLRRPRPLCVRGCRVLGSVRSTDRGGTGHGRARTSPRTGTGRLTDDGGKGHGRGRWDRLYRPSSPFPAFDLPFQEVCSVSSPSSPRSDSASPMPRRR
jgi:hypothetical protein